MSENQSAAPSSTETRPVKVWDLPTRVFHWGLLLAIAVAWLSGEQGQFEVHFFAGQVVLTLLLFRLIWGLIGSETVRFGNFVPTPGRLLGYLKAIKDHRTHLIVGHNPVGAAMVFALLVMVGVQVVSGLFASENTWAFVEGPLAGLIGSDLSEDITSLHKNFLFNILLALVALHVLASLFHLVVKRDNLILPMVTGTKAYPVGAIKTPPRMTSVWLALVILVVSGAVVWALFNLV